MDPNDEAKLRKYNGNVEIRVACEADKNLLSSIKISLEQPKQLIERVLSKLSLKGVPFKTYQASSENEIQSYMDILQRIEPNIKSLVANKDISKYPKFESFLEPLYTKNLLLSCEEMC